MSCTTVKRDNHPAIERGGEPEMEGVVGYADEKDEPASDDDEAASSTSTMVCLSLIPVRLYSNMGEAIKQPQPTSCNIVL